MRLFDGSAEYVAAMDIRSGDNVRCPDRQWREIVAAKVDGQTVTLTAADDYWWSSPIMTRELRKITT